MLCFGLGCCIQIVLAANSLTYMGNGGLLSKNDIPVLMGAGALVLAPAHLIWYTFRTTPEFYMKDILKAASQL